eukprot:scaffold204265_cov27-Tisochrysis_lutea.AAC.3
MARCAHGQLRRSAHCHKCGAVLLSGGNLSNAPKLRVPMRARRVVGMPVLVPRVEQPAGRHGVD